MPGTCDISFTIRGQNFGIFGALIFFSEFLEPPFFRKNQSLKFGNIYTFQFWHRIQVETGSYEYLVTSIEVLDFWTHLRHCCSILGCSREWTSLGFYKPFTQSYSSYRVTALTRFSLHIILYSSEKQSNAIWFWTIHHMTFIYICKVVIKACFFLTPCFIQLHWHQ